MKSIDYFFCFFLFLCSNHLCDDGMVVFTILFFFICIECNFLSLFFYYYLMIDLNLKIYNSFKQVSSVTA